MKEENVGTNKNRTLCNKGKIKARRAGLWRPDKAGLWRLSKLSIKH